MATEKYPIHSVRLDDEVWKALKAAKESANQILRRALNLNGPPPPAPPAQTGRQPRVQGELLKPRDQPKRK